MDNNGNQLPTKHLWKRGEVTKQYHYLVPFARSFVFYVVYRLFGSSETMGAYCTTILATITLLFPLHHDLGRAKYKASLSMMLSAHHNYQ